MYGRAGPLVWQPIRRAQPFTPSPPGCDMTPAELALARDGDAGATVGSVEVWRSIVGHGAVGDADYVKRRVKPEPAGAALDQVSAYVGSGTEVSSPDACGGRFPDRFVPVSLRGAAWVSRLHRRRHAGW